jgi:hypothetical protein
VQSAQILLFEPRHEEANMKRLLAAATIAAFGMVPAIGTACEYMDEASASAQPPAQLASTPAPAATKAPQAKATAPAPKASKQDVAKAKAAAPAPEQKVAAATSN